MQNPETQQNEGSRINTYLWIAGVAGIAAGLATLAARRRETAWERARRRTLEMASDAAETARKQVKPWMGVAAGAAMSGAGLAYKMRQKPTGLEVTQKRAGEVARQSSRALEPIIGMAVTAALSALSMARDPKQRRRLAEGSGPAVDKLAETGARLIRRVQQLSGETRKLYPSVKSLIA